jgi:hypothetical protein
VANLLLVFSSLKFIYLVYAYTYYFTPPSDPTITTAPSVLRYMAHTSIGCYLVFLYELQNMFQDRSKRVKYFGGIMVLFSMGLIINYFGEKLHSKFKPLESKLNFNFQKLCGIDNSDSLNKTRIHFLDQTRRGDTAVEFRIYAYPAKAIYAPCIGPARYQGDIWCHDAVLTPKNWADYLIEHKMNYIILFAGNDYLEKTLWPKSLPYPKSLPACFDAKEFL